MPRSPEGSQPAEDGREIAFFDQGFHAAQVRGKSGGQLRRDEVPQRVGGEIAHAAERPVYVLQYAVARLLRLHAEIFVHFGVPEFGRVSHFKFALEQHGLYFKAQHDMQIVSDLVRFYPDQGRGGLIDRLVEVFRGQVLEFAGEMRPVLRQDPL